MNLPTIQLTLTDAEGRETAHDLPAKFEVCGRCKGTGAHVNPAIDGNGISPERFADDPDFAEAYFAGHYDVPCEDCHGQRVVPVIDKDRCNPDLLAEYERQQRELAQCRAMEEAERRAEMRAAGEFTP